MKVEFTHRLLEVDAITVLLTIKLQRSILHMAEEVQL